MGTAMPKMSIEQGVDNCSVTYEPNISICNSHLSFVQASKTKKVHMGLLRQFGSGASSSGDGVAPSLFLFEIRWGARVAPLKIWSTDGVAPVSESVYFTHFIFSVTTWLSCWNAKSWWYLLQPLSNDVCFKCSQKWPIYNDNYDVKHHINVSQQHSLFSWKCVMISEKLNTHISHCKQ